MNASFNGGKTSAYDDSISGRVLRKEDNLWHNKPPLPEQKTMGWGIFLIILGFTIALALAVWAYWPDIEAFLLSV